MEIVLYGLCVIWGIALLIGAFLFLRNVIPDFGVIGGTVTIVLSAPFVVFLVLMGPAFVYEANSPVLATLRKSEWLCGFGHSETRLVLVGKVTVPQHVFVCDQYDRK